LRKISKIGAKVSISTLGKEGCILCLKNEGYKLPAYDTFTVDTTGAGDIFLSTFSILFSKGEEPLWCCSMAMAMSSCIVETQGAYIEADMKEIKNRAYSIYNKVEKI
jgi:adenosine kinase